MINANKNNLSTTNDCKSGVTNNFEKSSRGFGASPKIRLHRHVL